MKTLDFNGGIYSQEHEPTIYELFKTALSMGYTHIIDHFFSSTDELELDMIVRLMESDFPETTNWYNLDEATKLDLGSVELLTSLLPMKVEVIRRELNDEEKRILPEFFQSRIKPIDGAVVYYQENYTVVMQRMDCKGDERYATKMYVN